MPSAWSQSTAQVAQRPLRDARSARLAAGQWGVVSLRRAPRVRLDSAGDRGARARVACCTPSTVAVFAWGHHNISTEGRFLAAVKACGPYAVLSHYSAAALHGLVKWDGRPVRDHRADQAHAIRASRPTAATTIERDRPQGHPGHAEAADRDRSRARRGEDVVKRALRAAKFSAAELEQLPRSDPRPRCRARRGARSRTAPTTSSSRSGSRRRWPTRRTGCPARTVYPDLYWPRPAADRRGRQRRVARRPARAP